MKAENYTIMNSTIFEETHDYKNFNIVTIDLC